MRTFSYAVALAVGALVLPDIAHADLDPGCAGLGEALIGHSCFHATSGPYSSVTAVTRSQAASAPEIDAVHTYFEATLPTPGNENLLSYQVAHPDRVGAWAFFHPSDVSLAVETLEGQRLVPVFQGEIGGCALLPEVTVFQLGPERVRGVLGPTVQSRAFLVVENVDDFVIRNGRDTDGDGYGSTTDFVTTMCTPPAGYVQNDRDCNDADPAVHPGAGEICDGVDQNCNGSVDDVGLPCRAGVGVCSAEGTTACVTAGAPAVCSAAAGVPGVETCDGRDTSCNGIPDHEESGLCTAADAPACIVVRGETRCGCTRDEDCGSVSSGRICDAETRVCVVGCVGLAGRNGCPAGLVCSSTDPARPGSCVVPTEPDAGACEPPCGAPDDAGTPAVDAGDAGADEPFTHFQNDGCSCRTTPAASLPPMLGLWIVVAATLRSRRRAR